MSPFSGGGAIKRAPPGDIFLLTSAGMSLIWGKLVHPLPGYSIPPPRGALLVTPPMQWRIYFGHPLPPTIVGLLNLWPFMVAACMTVHRVQGVRFERVAMWIPSRGFFAQGQGYTAVSRGKTLDGLFLVLPDKVSEDTRRLSNHP